MSVNNTHTQTEYYSLVLVLTLNQSTELICWWPPSIMHHSRCHFEKRAIECSLFLANAPKWLTLVDVVQKKNTHKLDILWCWTQSRKKWWRIGRRQQRNQNRRRSRKNQIDQLISVVWPPELLTIRIEMNELFSNVVHLSYQTASFVHLCFRQCALVQLCPRSLGLFANLFVFACWLQ